MPEEGNQADETKGADRAASGDTHALARRLTGSGYAALFKAPGHERSLEDVWRSAPQADFERLAGDANAPPLARFLSSQILLSKDMSFFSRADLSSLSGIYVEALRGNYTGSMSDWGFLQRNDDTGVVGSAFLIFGERAIPQLVNLLSDATVVDYERPSPDVSGFDRTRLRKVRIKDFAALYLSSIKNVPIEFKTIFDERDEEIDKLKNSLSPQ